MTTYGINKSLSIDELDSYAFPMFNATGISLTSTDLEYLTNLEKNAHQFIIDNYDYFTKIVCDGKSRFQIGSEIGAYYDPYYRTVELSVKKYGNKILNKQATIQGLTDAINLYKNNDRYKESVKKWEAKVETYNQEIKQLQAQQTIYRKSLEGYYEEWSAMKKKFVNYINTTTVR